MSPTSFQICLYQMSFCSDFSDNVDKGELGSARGAFAVNCLIFSLTTEATERGFSFAGWKSPSRIPETSKVGQAGQG